MKLVEFHCRNCGKKFTKFAFETEAEVRCPYCNSSKVVETFTRYKVLNFCGGKRKNGLDSPKRFV